MEIVIILLLIVLNGLFAMSEVALISARRSSLSARARQGNRNAGEALRLAEDPDRFLSTVQIGITLIGIVTGIYSGEALAGSLGARLAAWGIPQRTAVSAAHIVVVILVTYFTIVFGELVPKRLGMNAAERIAILVARPMRLLSQIASPFVWLLARSIGCITRLTGIGETEKRITEAEIRSIVREGAEEGEVQAVEQRIVDRVFALGDRRVESIMTHRSEVAWIDTTMTPVEVRELIVRAPHTLYPAAEGNLDRLAGVIYLKELFMRLDTEGFSLREIVRPAKLFHEHTEVYSALEQLRNEQIGYGIVCDEFGVTQGIVTLRDMLEALVGTMPEEHEEPQIVVREDGSRLIDGQCPFYDFLVHFGVEDLHPARYNTVSGLLLDELEHIPQTGEKLEWNGFLFEIADMDGARIDKLLVSKIT